MLPPLLHFPFYSPLPTPTSYLIMVFSFVCSCYSTRSVTFAYLLCIRPSTSVLCRSFPPWPLPLFANCVFALNKMLFFFHKSDLMNDLTSWTIYGMEVSQVWEVIPYSLNSSVWVIIPHGFNNLVWWLSLTASLNKVL